MSEGRLCESCTYYVYSEECEDYECLVTMDEDEYYALVSGRQKGCPYYREDNEYAVVKKQM